MIRLFTSSEKVGHDSSGDVGETEITAGIAIRQLGVIKAELMQQCGVKVVHVYLILRRREMSIGDSAAAPAGVRIRKRFPSVLGT